MEAAASKDVLVDALPYIDTGYDEAARLAATALIEEECKRYRPTKDYLAHLPLPKLDAFETELMHGEMERMARREGMEPLSMRRCELPSPSAGRLTDVGAWHDALNNARAQQQHLHLELENVELAAEYGAEALKAQNSLLERQAVAAQRSLAAVKADVQRIHLERKRKQTQAGARLKALEQAWVGLITKNYQIEQACAEIESEVEPLRKKYKTSET